MSMDIETNVPADFSFPQPQVEEIIQIASMVARHNEEEPFSRCVMTVNSCSSIDRTQVISYKTEKAMLEAWFRHFQEVDPDVLTGYNTSRFDLPYIFIRAEQLGIGFDLGRLKGTLPVILIVGTFGPRNCLLLCVAAEQVFDTKA
ncbi:DNA polymerase delta catalytic subunit [Marasmius tenuissimus]|nr:DNA polymerase delta catalytic subunit [Marasmius tenuissimus]